MAATDSPCFLPTPCPLLTEINTPLANGFVTYLTLQFFFRIFRTKRSLRPLNDAPGLIHKYCTYEAFVVGKIAKI